MPVLVAVVSVVRLVILLWLSIIRSSRSSEPTDAPLKNEKKK